jgi:hypothetical protein
MPSQFISRTTSSPNDDRPLFFGVSVAESAHGRVRRVRQRHVARAEDGRNMRKSASELSIEWPPSMPMSDAILPAL